MDRFAWRKGSFLLLLTAATLVCVTAGGCSVGALATAMYLIKGHNVPAEYAGLKGKRVAVVCRPSESLAYSNNPNTAADLAEQVGKRLQAGVPKIHVIDQQEVSEWTDENTLEDYVKLGQALKADLVVGIDLEDFTLYQGQTLFQGKSTVRIKVYDVKTNTVVFEKFPPQSVFPPNTGISTQEKQEAEFLRQYLAELSDEIGRHFYTHDSYVSFAQDTAALE